MIPRCIHSKGRTTQIALQFQWLNIAVRLSSKSLSSSSSSSSSDSSSDSDSDTEKKSQMKEPVKKIIQESTDKNVQLDTLLMDMLNSTSRSKSINVAIEPKVRKPKKPLEQQPYVYRLKAAADAVANKLGGDTESITSQLLKRVEKRQPLKDIRPTHINNAVSDIMNKKVDESDTRTEPLREKKSIMRQMLGTPRLARLSKNVDSRTQARFQDKTPSGPILTNLFPNVADRAPDIPELKTWNALEQKELNLLVTHAPENVFQEQIRWTEEGKLWKFPIDNEQGMEQEHSVHFSEHVFMERHLKDWCPKHGPVRHFMELVCVGLSKNPYLTVEEKLSHIAWYKQFFDDKKDLLQELGAIETPSSDSVKQIES